MPQPGSNPGTEVSIADLFVIVADALVEPQPLQQSMHKVSIADFFVIFAEGPVAGQSSGVSLGMTHLVAWRGIDSTLVVSLSLRPLHLFIEALWLLCLGSSGPSQRLARRK